MLILNVSQLWYTVHVPFVPSAILCQKTCFRNLSLLIFWHNVNGQAIGVDGQCQHNVTGGQEMVRNLPQHDLFFRGMVLLAAYCPAVPAQKLDKLKIDENSIAC